MILNEEQLAFKDMLTRLVDNEIRPIVPDLELTDRFPHEIAEIFGDMGLLQLWIPEEYGGPGGNLTTVCLAKEEIAKGCLSASALCANNSIGLILPLLYFGTEEQKQRYLPEAAKGRTIAAVAITEPQTGSDVSSMKTRAVKDGDSWIINGQKNWITWAAEANYALVFARTSDQPGSRGISAFLVDTKTPGYAVGRKEAKMGRHGAPSYEIFFEDMRVPADCMIGEEGNGFRACMRILDLNRPTVAASSLGLAQAALDASVDYAKTRVQFGKPVGEFQGMQFKLASMAMKVEAARSLVYSCAEEIDSGDFSRLAYIASTTKSYVTDMAMDVTSQAVQVLGAYGYSPEYNVERMMRDAKLNQILEGTSEIQHLVVGRHLMRAGNEAGRQFS